MDTLISKKPVTPGTSAETAAVWSLGENGRRLLMTVHVALACVWIGALVAMLLLISAQLFNPVTEWRPGLDRAVLLINDRLVINASYGFVFTGLCFSLFTRWGAFRFRWVALKWLLVGVLGVALPLWVAPHVSSMTALSDALAGDVATSAPYASHVNAVMLAVSLQLLVLLSVVSISVFKPWGRRKVRFHWPRPLSFAFASMIVIALLVQLYIQNVQLEGYRRLPVPVVDVSMLHDGTYTGQDTQAGFTYRVRVTVTDGCLTGIEVLANRDTRYARLAVLSVDRLVGLSHNDVDGISGATTTGKALLRAVANALETAP
jgi:uncharacterized protein with FMN-binding domain